MSILVTIQPYDDIQNWLDIVGNAGGGILSLNPVDTFFPTSDLIIPSGVVINGNGGIVDFGGGAYQFRAEGSNPYSDGTVDVAFGSTTVTGTATIWTSDMEGQEILLGENWYVISTVTSATSLEIESAFIAPDITGDTYVIATTVQSTGMTNITLQNSTVSLYKFQYADGVTCDQLSTFIGDIGMEGLNSANLLYSRGAVDTCDTGISLNNVPYLVLDNFGCFNTVSNAIELTRVSNSTLSVFSVQSIGGVGVQATNCGNFTFQVYSIIECGSHGFEFVSGNSDIDVSSGYVNTVGGDGMKLTATSDRIGMSSTSFLNTTGYGVNIANANCDNNIIISNNFDGSGSGAVNDSGTATLIRSNQGVADN